MNPQYVLGVTPAIVAALAIIVNAWTSRRALDSAERNQVRALQWQERSQTTQIKMQADAALADRLWHKRAELYVRVLVWTEHATEIGVAWKGNRQEVPDGKIEPPEEVFREIALFAPTDISRQFVKARDKAHEFEWNTRRQSPQFLERELPNVYRELNRLRMLVRADIQGGDLDELLQL